jgi:alginate O-acetyltransferase complex protein AlgI
MLFSGLPFLYYFLPAVILLYFIAPKKLKNSALLLSSLVFYGWGEPKYIFLIFFSIIYGWVSGLLTEKATTKKWKLFWTVSNVVVSIGLLGVFKYADFFVSNFNALTGLSVPLLRLALPIGISFYTFQILSYTVDVYRGDVPAQKNIIDFATYVVLFPQLIAGPIVRYSDVAKELKDRKSTIESVALGLRRFVFGLGKKVLIANALGELCDIYRASNEKTVLFSWVYAIAFSLHIYFDFSGYSDMAIGLGKIFGFNFIENFNYPYISRSITEFWRRWHMSLGSWFRDYVYIPMGGNRVNTFRRYFNIFTVWMLTGFWHGAEWNFILWGLMFAVLLVIEKVWLLKHLNKSKVLNHVYVLFFVAISFVLFNGAGTVGGIEDIGRLFGIGAAASSASVWYYIKSYALIFVIAIIGATPLPKMAVEKIRAHKVGGKIINTVEPFITLAMLVVITAFLVDGSFNPFLYFRF